jgi:hypothetical protein
MKILTKEEEAEHYRATLKGGTIGGVLGLGAGFAGVALASQRSHFFRTLTLPLKAFLVTSSGTFAGIISADHYSRKYEQERNPIDKEYAERREQQKEQAAAGKSFTQRATEFARAERYKIVGGSWILSMVAAFAIVNRNKYLTGQQKLVQARVYAQFLTLGVLVASAAFEISDSRNQQGRWETVKYIDPKDPEHKRVLEKRVEASGGSGVGGQREDRGNKDMWKDMIQAEEERLKERDEDEKRWRKEVEGKKNGGKKHKKEAKSEEKDEKSDDSKDENKDDGKEKKDNEKKDEKKK